MTDAPERIMVRADYDGTHEYIRADLHQQALDAAREEGRRVGYTQAVEDAQRVGPIPCYEARHVTLGDKVRNAIMALAQKEG